MYPKYNNNMIIKNVKKKNLIIYIYTWWGTVAHTCNPATWEAEIKRVSVPDQQDKKFVRLLSQPGCGGVHLSSQLGGRLVVQACLGINVRSYLKNSESKKSWGHVWS
jgi:hypothetical protein